MHRIRARHVLILLILCILLSPPLSARGRARFNGTWRGTFRDMPTGTEPRTRDNPAGESTHPFELTLHEKGRWITGEFRQTDAPGPSQRVKHAGRFGDRACFDVMSSDGENEDMRFCVVLQSGNLTGIWSGGPQGGPILGGMGPGARLFEVRAKRVPRKQP